MRRHRVVMVVAGAAAVWCLAPLTVTPATAARAVTRAGTWGTAIEVPGLQSLNQGGMAELNSVSCGSAGNCTAVGSYQDGSVRTHAFLVGERNGLWRSAIEVPGSQILNVLGAAATSVSCVSAGNCTAVGGYQDSSDRRHVFVVSKANGTWGTATEMPGLGTLSQSGDAWVSGVSCATAGNCAAGGHYTDSAGHQQAFVASETNGTWGRAIKVPGSGILNAGGTAVVYSVSCRSAGNCAASGYYMDSAHHNQAFVVSETNGTWGRAIEVPGSGTLNAGGNAIAGSLSCRSAGNCAAGGYYTDSTHHPHAFVVSETNGTWGTATQVPGLDALDVGGSANINSLSCTATGYCAVGGIYRDGAGHIQVFVVSETNGTWGTAIQVPGSGTLNAGGFANVTSVSCATAGNCAAGGSYTESAGHEQAFVVSETNGTWGTAIQVPGSSALNAGGGADLTSVSCRSAGICAAGGFYHDGAGHVQAFVVNQS